MTSIALATLFRRSVRANSGERFYNVFRDLLDVEECTVFSFLICPSQVRCLLKEVARKNWRSLASWPLIMFLEGSSTTANMKRNSGGLPIEIYVMDFGKYC